MNIISFDIEEWALAKTGNYGSKEQFPDYELCLRKILDELDAKNVKGTFFCTGLMGADFPEIVTLIASHGHEIGCHSNAHTWMNKMSYQEAREDTKIAIDTLEQCIGEKVKSYRAPAFSIGNTNKWMFDVFAEFGIENDSSIFPAERDFGGFPEFSEQKPSLIIHNGISIKEFPIPITNMFGHEMAYSGGGYFRLFPLWFVRNKIKYRDYCICYFHINDLLPELYRVMSKAEFESYFKEPGTLKNRYARYFKANIGKKNALDKLFKLISSTDFINIQQADNTIDWSLMPVVNL